jgi:hypothetical protein
LADFAQQPDVINGASDLLEKIWGKNGRYARAAVSAKKSLTDFSNWSPVWGKKLKEIFKLTPSRRQPYHSKE